MTPRDRWRVVAVSALVMAFTFVQAPGRMVGDTKADLVLAPGDFLMRALNLWDPNGSFGQIQNQAYGYLFPMGPFFGLGSALGLPEWVIQRLWWSLLLIVALTGFIVMARALGAGSPSATLVGAVAYALSPRIITLIGSSSVEVWPMALAPWVLFAVVRGSRDARPLGWAWLAAFLVAVVGGVNAVATAAVLVLPMVWLLVAPAGPSRRRMLIAWPVFTILATIWWFGPLVLLGRYSPPFLDYIESASTTTGVATIVDALRGTTNWLPYLDGAMTAGHSLITQPVVILNGLVVVLLGLFGLAWRAPHARFLVGGLLLGTVLVTAGHAGTNLASGTWQEALDGLLAPLRNTHKFDPIVRLPLAVGVVVFIDRMRDLLERDQAPKWLHPAGAVLAGAAIIGSTVPVWSGELPRAGTWQTTPNYWQESATWLAENAAGDRTLMLPESAFGDYLWGSPRDEVMQAYASTPWAVRSGVPLTPPGTIRMLDALGHEFSTGVADAALAAALRRAGIDYVLVRNDLQNVDPVDTERVYSTLRALPGARRVAAFGPVVGSPPSQTTEDGERVFVNWGLQSRHQVVEIFSVGPKVTPSVRLQAAATTQVLVGAGADVLDADGSVDPDVSSILAQDAPTGWTPPHVVVTDTFRRREVAVGRVPLSHSATVSLDDKPLLDRPVRDYVRPQDAFWQAVRVDVGGRIRASSSASDVTEPVIDVRAHPGAALDGDPETAWVAGSGDSPRAWWQVTFDVPQELSAVSIRLGSARGGRTVTVATDDGTTEVQMRPGQQATLDLGTSKRLRIAADSTALDPFSLAEVAIPDHPVARPLWVPTPADGWPVPREINLSTGPEQPGCHVVAAVHRCAAQGGRLSEDGRSIDRVVTMKLTGRYAVAMETIPEATAYTVEQFAGDVKLRTGSRFSDAIEQSPLAMLDSDPSTGWIAGASDGSPLLFADLPRPTKITAVRLFTDPTLAASSARRGTMTFDDGSRQEVRFDDDGYAAVDEVTTTSFRLEVTDVRARSTLSFDGTGTVLPLGVSEFSLPGSGVTASADADRVVRAACGSGPELTIDGQRRRSALQASRRYLVTGQPVEVRICDGRSVTLEPGVHRVRASASRFARPTRVRLSTLESVEATVESRPFVEHTTDAWRTNGGISGDAFISVPHSHNAGWVMEGATPVTVGGWRQGWWVSAGKGDAGLRLEASFAPALGYRIMLAVGCVAFVTVAVFALRRRHAQPLAPSAERTRRGLGLLVGWLVTSVLVGGGIGLVAGMIGLLSGRLRAGRAIVVISMAPVILWYAMRPWGHHAAWAGDASWPQWLVLVSLGAVVGLTGARVPRLRSRMAGRSMSR